MTVRFTLRSVLLLTMVVFVLLTVAVFTIIGFENRRAAMFSNADNLMKTGAAFAQEWLEPNYHDHISDRHSVTPEEFACIVQRHDQLCQKLGLQYIWSLLELDGQLVFTTATHTVLTNQHSACAGFLDVHTNPEAYRHALATMQPEFTTFHDKWGAGRMVLLPAWDRKHRKYLFAASIQLESFDALLQRTLMESIVVGLAVGVLFSLLGWMLARMITRPLTRLSRAIDRMRTGDMHGEIQRGALQEVRMLADAFEGMRDSVQQKVVALQESEERYRGLVESLGLGVSLISPRMEVLALNRQVREWYPDLQLEGRPLCFQAFNKPPRTTVCEHCPVVLTLQDGEPHETVTNTAHGDQVVNYRIKSAPVKDAAGRITAVIETVEDITERKRIEDALIQSEANLSAVTNSTQDLIFSVDAQHFRVLQFNAAHASEIKRVYGVELRPGMTVREILPTPELWAVWEGLFQRALAQGSFEHEYLRPQDQHSFSVSINPMYHDQRVASLSVFIHDITERKRAEQNLRESQAQLAAVFGSTEDLIWSANAYTLEILSFNAAFAQEVLRTYGVHLQLGLNLREGIPAEMVPIWEQLLQRAIKVGRYTDEYFRKDNRYFERTFNPIVNADSSCSVAVYVRDITARKRAEAELIASENRLRAFLNNSAVIGWMKDEAGRYVFLSDNYSRRIGKRPEDMLGRTDAELWSRSVADSFIRNDRAVLDGGQAIEVIEQAPNPDGSLSSWLNSKFVFTDVAGKRYVGGLGVDITARLQAEQQLRVSEEKYRSVIEAMSEGVVVHNAAGEIIANNRAAESILGLTADQMQGKSSLDPLWQCVHEDGSLFAGADHPALVSLREGKNMVGVVMGVHTPGGELKWISINTALLSIPGTSPAHAVIASFADITARKQVEDELRKSKAQLTAVLESTQDLVWSVDAHTFAVLAFNLAFAQFIKTRFGVTLRPGLTAREILPADRFEFWEQQMRVALQTESHTMEYEVPGSPLHLEVVFNSIRSEGRVVALSIFAKDIAARKQAEVALRQSEEKYRALVETTNTGFLILDAQGKVLDANEEYVRLTGHAALAEIVGRSVVDWTAPHDRERNAREVALCLARGFVRNLEFDYIDHQGKLTPIDCNATVVGRGGDARILALCRDITARRRTAEALREAQAHLASVVESTEDLIWSVNALSLELLSFNSAFATEILCTYGIRVQPCMNLRDFLPADRVPSWESLLQRAIREGRFTDTFFRSNNPKWYERTFNPIVKAGRAIAVSIFARDITARRQAELALRESEAKFSRLATHIEDVLYSVDAATREFRYVNPSFQKMFGYSLEDIQLMGGRRAFLATVIENREFKQQDDYLEQLQRNPAFTAFRTEAWWRCKDGTRRCVRDHWIPVYEADQLVSTEGILTDISQEKEAEARLRENAAQLKEAQELAKLGNFNWDVASNVVTWSDELYDMWGMDRNEPVPSMAQHRQLFPPECWPHVQSVFQHAAQSGEDYVLETEFLRRDGTRGHLLAYGKSTRDPAGCVVRIVGTAQDVTERKRLQQQLLEISEREQRRIGQDLHDGVGQQLAAMRFQSSTLLQKLAGRKKVSVTEVERLDHLLAETLQQVRNLSRGLHPVSLDSHGLMHGLRELARQCLALLGVPCAFDCADPVLVQDPRAALNLYRIAQEAVRNAAVHGAPQHIRVGLAETEGHVRLTVADDGRGLPPDVKAGRGLGLEIMRYRAASIGATCDIQSQPGAGVTILCGWRTPT